MGRSFHQFQLLRLITNLEHPLVSANDNLFLFHIRLEAKVLHGLIIVTNSKHHIDMTTTNVQVISTAYEQNEITINNYLRKYK